MSSFANTSKSLLDSALSSVGKVSKKKKKKKTSKAGYAPLASSDPLNAGYSLDPVTGAPNGGSSNGPGFFSIGEEGSSDEEGSDSEDAVSYASARPTDRLIRSRSGTMDNRLESGVSETPNSITPMVSGGPSPSRSLRHVPSLIDLPHSPSTGDAVQNTHDSLLAPPPKDYHNPVPPITPLNSAQFLAIVDEVRMAIAEGIYPTRISQGSSGSYFCRNRAGEIVGVFKPKNEEPYGHLNPKWTKWIHKNLFPCCFGRSCLIPNLGYISEAAASYVDRRLQLNVCPRTEVVSLASPSFFYPLSVRRAYRQGKPLPPKIGSFQIFLRGFKDATTFFKEGYDQVLRTASEASLSRAQSNDSLTGAAAAQSTLSITNPAHPLNWSEETQREFQMGFERLVILDYLIRNTDRGSDNWMIKYTPPKPEEVSPEPSSAPAGSSSPPMPPTSSTTTTTPATQSEKTSTEKVATIDVLALDGSAGEKGSVSGESEGTAVNMVNGTTSSRSSSPPLTPSTVIGENGTTVTIANGNIPPTTTPPQKPEMIHINVPSTSPAPAPTTTSAPLHLSHPREPSIRIAAIDNGLAFPYKHPDRWRSYPYGWAPLPIARLSFSASTRNQVLHLLTSQEWWRETLDGLERLFRIDPDFN
ncbi:phosphatidyl inositol kinase, partial [Quaeritorhiza haematococci]